MPTMPQKLAGWRIEPPVSVAGRPQRQPRRHRRRRPAGRAARHQRPRCRRAAVQGLVTGPKAEVMFDEPMANSSRLALPRNTAPSRSRLRGDGAFVGRHEGAEDRAAGGGAHALGAEQILDGQRNAGRAARPRPRASARIGGVGLGAAPASGVTVMKAFSRGFSASMAPR